MTEADASEKRQKEFVARSEMFQIELDVDETLSQLLVAEGFGELEEVAYVGIDELAAIEGFDEELAQELQSRAQEALDRREAAAREERQALGVEDLILRDHIVDVEQIGRQRVDLIGGEGSLSIEGHAPIDVVPHHGRIRRAERQDSPPCPGIGI